MNPVPSGTFKTYFIRRRKAASLEDTNLHFDNINHQSISRLAAKLSNVFELSAVTGHRPL